MAEQIKKMAQVAIVVRDIEAKAKAYADFFGVDVPSWSLTGDYQESNSHYLGAPTKARAKLAFFQLENIQIELIEPVGGPSTWQNYLDTKGEGIHHIAFWVPDMPAEIEREAALGLKLEQKGDFTGGGYAYMDGNAKLGAIVELLTNTR